MSLFSLRLLVAYAAIFMFRWFDIERRRRWLPFSAAAAFRASHRYFDIAFSQFSPAFDMALRFLLHFAIGFRLLISAERHAA